MKIDREQSEHHESFGMLQISRVQGGRGSTRLFGSHLNYHEHTIQLRVLRAYRSFHLSTEWFSPENALPVVEIEMSAAQFAEAITSMNRGAGTPCTIRSVETETMEDLPDEHVPEHRIIVGDFKEEVEGLVLDLNEQLEELDAILDKRHLNKADRAAIRSIVNRSVKLAEDSAPFMVIAAKASQQLTAGDD